MWLVLLARVFLRADTGHDAQWVLSQYWRMGSESLERGWNVRILIWAFPESHLSHGHSLAMFQVLELLGGANISLSFTKMKLKFLLSVKQK